LAPDINTPPLRDYLGIVSRRKVMIVALAGLIPAAAFAYSLSQQPLYRATAEVLVTQQNLPSGVTNGSLPPPLEDPDRFAVTQARLARTAAVLRSTLAATGVGESLAKLRAESSVSAAPDADFLEFSVTNRSDRRTALLAAAYARQFTLYRSRLDTVTLLRARADVAARLGQLKRAHQTNSQLYSSLLTENQHLTTLDLLQSPRAVLVGRPTGAAKIGPRPVRNTLVAAGFGVLVALAVAFLLEALDTRIHSTAELADSLGLPLLGTTPAPTGRTWRPEQLPLLGTILATTGRTRRPEQLVMLVDPTSPQAEAFRKLRLNFDLVNLESGARLVMVASALSGEGKSATAANLAIASARAGHVVLVVDSDLRKPQLHEFFGLSPQPGLTDVTLGRTELAAAIVPVPLPRANDSLASVGDQGIGGGSLSILPAGLVPPDPGSIVEMKSFAALLATLRSRYELVFIDSPPLLQVADGIALSSRTDALVVVARVAKSRRSEVGKLRRVLETIPVPKLGVVITGAKRSADYANRTVYGRSAGEQLHSGASPVPLERRGRIYGLNEMSIGELGQRAAELGFQPGKGAGFVSKEDLRMWIRAHEKKPAAPTRFQPATQPYIKRRLGVERAQNGRVREQPLTPEQTAIDPWRW
jgi:polysaccharide biosynthesis transport protein